MYNTKLFYFSNDYKKNKKKGKNKMKLQKIDTNKIVKVVKNCTTPKQKTIIKEINIASKWENQLPLYLELYSRLSPDGKKEMQNQVATLGKLVDIIQKTKNDQNKA